MLCFAVFNELLYYLVIVRSPVYGWIYDLVTIMQTKGFLSKVISKHVFNRSQRWFCNHERFLVRVVFLPEFKDSVWGCRPNSIFHFLETHFVIGKVHKGVL